METTMSFDSEVKTNTLEPKPNTQTDGRGNDGKNNRRRGCGFLALLILIAVGGFAFYWFNYEIPLRNFVKGELNLATSSQQLGDLLGTPLITGTPIRKMLESAPDAAPNDPPKIEVTIPISGTGGKGKLILLGEKKPNADGKTKWIKESLILDFEGKQTDLNPEEEMIPELDIDLGF
jgi:hypothetical protein